MTNRRIVGAVALAFALASGTALAPIAAVAQEKTVMVGGAAMYPSKDIVDNAVNSKDHTTLVAALKAAGLVETLKSAGPFTVFAPTNAAFAALPAGTVETLLKPESKPTLVKVLTYHVVAGKVDAATLTGLIAKDGGKHTVKTVSGDMLVASVENGKVVITDAKGGKATVTIADVMQKNGVIHVVDKVLLPYARCDHRAAPSRAARHSRVHARGAALRRLAQLRDGDMAAHALGLEHDLVAGLHGGQHLGLAGAEDHRHGVQSRFLMGPCFIVILPAAASIFVISPVAGVAWATAVEAPNETAPRAMAAASRDCFIAVSPWTRAVT